MQTLKASGGDLGGGTENLVIMTCAKQSIYEYVQSEKSACLQATNFIAGGGGDEALIVYDITHQEDVIREYEDVSPTLTARFGTGGEQRADKD